MDEKVKKLCFEAWKMIETLGNKVVQEMKNCMIDEKLVKNFA
jgi:hypothetical protein